MGTLVAAEFVARMNAPADKEMPAADLDVRWGRGAPRVVA